MQTYELPWPPSVNSYWRAWVKAGAVRTLLSAAGRRYRDDCVAAVWAAGCPRRAMVGRLAVRIAVHPPDRRTHDLDNLLKAVLDGLAYSRVYQDDSQIDDLRVLRREVHRPGCVVVEVEEIEACE